ncbi:MAG TPA: GNAT family N-acetyltransferase [Bryobacteraceae bacterium]|nr:GNAT family N-acetyltransferase [Bryobacteraceae bacterium]
MIRVERGAAATAMLQDASFLTAWQSLLDICPWSTCFQDPNFVATWYDCYSDHFDPLIVCDEDPAAGLAGLIPMATEKPSGRLVVAGTVHAEYKTWLALPEHADAFADSAFGRLAQLFPKDHLELAYLAPGTPLGWFENWRDKVFVRPIDRPLMRAQPADSARASLGGKKNRARIRKLEQSGPLVFERIVNPADFSAALDEIIPMCDFRHGAAHGVLAFRDDGRKRRFHEELMRQADGLLHITVTRLNGRIIAANIGWCNKQQVLLGTLTHSPFFAEHSPGKLHILQLGLHLEEEGFHFLDLTPGGSYKESFATGSDTSSIVDIFFSGARARRYAWKRKAIETGKRFVSADRFRHAVRAFRRAIRVISAPGLGRKIGRRAVRSAWDSCEYRIYRKAARDTLQQSIDPPRRMRRDCLEDLLCYRAAETWQPTLFEFLQTAMQRLEEGEHVYTLVENGLLVHYGWLIERQDVAYFPEVDQKFPMPPQSAVLYDYFTHPASRGRRLYQCSLREMSADAANIAGTEFIYISVVADNAPSRHSIEKAGFEYQSSLYRKVVLGVRVRS